MKKKSQTHADRVKAEEAAREAKYGKAAHAKKVAKDKGMLFGKPRGDVVKHPGAFGKKAAAAGKTTAQLAASALKPGSKASAQTKKQAALAKAFATMRKHKGK